MLVAARKELAERTEVVSRSRLIRCLISPHKIESVFLIENYDEKIINEEPAEG